MAFSISKILTSNHDFTPDEYELKLYFVLFNTLLLFNSIYASFGIIYRFAIHQYTHALIDVVFLFFALPLFLMARKSKMSLYRLMWVMITFSFAIISVMFYYNFNPLAGISWYVFILLLTYVFKGYRASIVIFILSMGVVFFVSLTQWGLPLSDIILWLQPYGSLVFFFYAFYHYNEKLRIELQNQKLIYAHLAHYDSLTEIPNRNALLTFFEGALTSHSNIDTKLAVLFIDLDDFKQVNDRYGHTMGDRVLRLVAERLRRQIRNSDMLARHGGDEFVLVAQSITDRQDIEKILTHIFQAMQEPIVDMKHAIHVTLSIGVAIAPQDGTQIDALLKHADQAMYHAKKSGKNTYSFYEDPR